MKRQPLTVYFQHFEQHGLYVVFDSEDARICRAVTKRMVYNEETFEAGKARFEAAGFRVELAPPGLERKASIENWKPRARRQAEVPLAPSLL